MTNDLLVHLARFAGHLRSRGLAIGVGDEVDAARALLLVDLSDRAEVHRALRVERSTAVRMSRPCDRSSRPGPPAIAGLERRSFGMERGTADVHSRPNSSSKTGQSRR